MLNEDELSSILKAIYEFGERNKQFNADLHYLILDNPTLDEKIRQRLQDAFSHRQQGLTALQVLLDRLSAQRREMELTRGLIRALYDALDMFKSLMFHAEKILIAKTAGEDAGKASIDIVFLDELALTLEQTRKRFKKLDFYKL